MRLDEFKIGGIFCSGQWLWRTTDIGTRVVVAMRVGVLTPQKYVLGIGTTRTADLEAACDELFKYPPSQYEEEVFNEIGMKGCSLIEQ